MTEDSGQYRFSWEPAHGDQENLPGGFWVFVNGGDLPCEVALRIHRHADGRYAFTGIVIAEPPPAPQEVTSQVLRKIRLAEIQASLFGPGGLPGGFDPAQPKYPVSTFSGGARFLADVAAAQGQTAGGRSRGPSDAQLRDFARTYQFELGRQPRRAMSAAAKAHNISRATANRWAAACREVGYLPTAPEEEAATS